MILWFSPVERHTYKQIVDDCLPSLLYTIMTAPISIVYWSVSCFRVPLVKNIENNHSIFILKINIMTSLQLRVITYIKRHLTVPI